MLHGDTHITRISIRGLTPPPYTRARRRTLPDGNKFMICTHHMEIGRNVIMARLHAVISIVLCAFPTVTGALRRGGFSGGGEWLIKKRGVDHPSSPGPGARRAVALLVYLSRRVASRRAAFGRPKITRILIGFGLSPSKSSRAPHKD